jgi:SAM-dependent methyltransferase
LAAGGWIAFWNRPHRIYANRRHLEAHYRRLFEDLRPHLPSGSHRAVLDFGCGDALAAGQIAGMVGAVLLYDAAPATRARLEERFSRDPRITVVSESALAAMTAASVDLALLISVVQYLDRAALLTALGHLKRLLKADGRLLVADVIDPETPVVQDVVCHLRFAAQNGFFVAALGALARVLVSDYRRVRADAGFATFRPADFVELLGTAGFRALRLPRNIGPSPHRHAFLAQPLPPAPPPA